MHPVSLVLSTRLYNTFWFPIFEYIATGSDTKLCGLKDLRGMSLSCWVMVSSTAGFPFEFCILCSSQDVHHPSHLVHPGQLCPGHFFAPTDMDIFSLTCSAPLWAPAWGDASKASLSLYHHLSDNRQPHHFQIVLVLQPASWVLVIPCRFKKKKKNALVTKGCYKRQEIYLQRK